MRGGEERPGNPIGVLSTVLLLVLACVVFFGFLVVSIGYGSLGLPIPSVSKYRLVSVGCSFVFFLGTIVYPYWPVARAVYRGEGVSSGLRPVGRIALRCLYSFLAWRFVIAAVFRADPQEHGLQRSQVPEASAESLLHLILLAAGLALVVGLLAGSVWCGIRRMRSKGSVEPEQESNSFVSVFKNWSGNSAVLMAIFLGYAWADRSIGNHLPGGFLGVLTAAGSPDFVLLAPVKFQLAIFALYSFQFGGFVGSVNVSPRVDEKKSDGAGGSVFELLAQESRLFLLAACVSAVVLILVYYSIGVFPRLPQYLGGGRPLVAVLAPGGVALESLDLDPVELLELGDDVLVRPMDGGAAVIVSKSKLAGLLILQPSRPEFDAGFSAGTGSDGGLRRPED